MPSSTTMFSTRRRSATGTSTRAGIRSVASFCGARSMRGLLACAVVVATLGCASIGQSPNEETMLIKASALTKLSAAAESAVRYKDAPEDLTDRALLQWATSHDPALLAPFSAYTLKVLRQDRHA